MAKKLRVDPIYIAPDIIGYINNFGIPIVRDERNSIDLDPRIINDKITIYKRQVEDWFLIPATNMLRYNKKNKGFILLMICLSYIEGVEQYRRGQSSRNNSSSFFVGSMQRIYPILYEENQLQNFYSEARCGIFHNGMVGGRIIINFDYLTALQFDNDDIMVNPKIFLDNIKHDFSNYILELQNQNNINLRNNFNRMYSNI